MIKSDRIQARQRKIIVNRKREKKRERAEKIHDVAFSGMKVMLSSAVFFGMLKLIKDTKKRSGLVGISIIAANTLLLGEQYSYAAGVAAGSIASLIEFGVGTGNGGSNVINTALPLDITPNDFFVIFDGVSDPVVIFATGIGISTNVNKELVFNFSGADGKFIALPQSKVISTMLPEDEQSLLSLFNASNKKARLIANEKSTMSGSFATVKNVLKKNNIAFSEFFSQDLPFTIAF